MSDDRRTELHSTPERADPAGRPLSVWAISPGYWPVFSGAIVQAQRLYRALAEEGYSINVLTSRLAQTAAHPRVEIVEGVRVTRLSVLPPWWSGVRLFGAVWRMLCALSFALACALRIVRARQQIDVLHIHAGFLPPLVILARLLGIPVVVKQTMLEGRRLRLGGRLHYWAAARADKLITLSRTMSDHHARLDEAKLEMIPQGVDTALFRPVSDTAKKKLRESLHLDPNAVFVVFIGTIEHRKGVDILARAFIEAVEQCPHLAMILIGQHGLTGHPWRHVAQGLQRYRASLEADLAEQGLAGRVTWTGRLPSSEVARYLQAADLFCLPSRAEGVPSAPLEAMASGLPVVVSALDGTSEELLTDGREGFIIDGEEPADYARRIVALASDGELARNMGRAGRQRVKDAFSFQRAVERYRDLFSSLTHADRV